MPIMQSTAMRVHNRASIDDDVIPMLLRRSLAPILLAIVACTARTALAYGDFGHMVIAHVARANLTERAAREVDRLLALDRDALPMIDGGSTGDSFARQSTWADYYRDSQRAAGKPREKIQSYSWHFVNIDLGAGSLDAACAGFARLAPGRPASAGPDPDCVVNKIEQFASELEAPTTPDGEKLLALKFLLHLVGDLHQPLHVADDMDRGGNTKAAMVAGGKPASLHFHWDTTFVDLVRVAAGPRGVGARTVAASLRRPSDTERASWLGKPQVREWAMESFSVGRAYAYGRLPPADIIDGTPVFRLGPEYVTEATRAVAEQLNKGGHRLAAILNRALGK